MKLGLITSVSCDSGAAITALLTQPADPPTPSTVFETFAAMLIAKGHGLAALSGFFSVAAERILTEIVRLDLPTPHDRPCRTSNGPNAWTRAQTQQLILLWSSDLFATCIADRVGRSASSVRYKARWLGLPVRDRSTLRRVPVEIAIDIPLVAFPAERMPELTPTRPFRKRGPNLSHIFNSVATIRLIGEHHLTGVNHDVTAATLGCRKIDIERRIKGYGLPNRSCLRGRLFSNYDPSRPHVEQFRHLNFTFRAEGCLYDQSPFWGAKNERLSPKAKGSRRFQELAGGY